MSNDLFNQHLDRARRIARAVAGKVPPNVVRHDLEQAALLGLYQWCSDHPDSGQPGWLGGLTLRVRGAVTDCLRQHDFLTRRARARGDLGVVHLEDLSYDDGRGWDEMMIGESSHEDSTLDRLQALEALEADMPERDRHLVVEAFGKGTQQLDLARKLGVTEARVSQLLARATRTMRQHLDGERKPKREPVSIQVPATPKFRVRDFKRELWLERRNALWQQLQPGMSMRDLARRLDMPPTTIYNWCSSKRMHSVQLWRSDPITDQVRQRGIDLVDAALRAENGNSRRAADLLRLGHSAVCAWRRRLVPDAPRCDPGPASRVDRASLMSLRARGLSDRQIALEVGMHHSSVHAALKKAGVPPCGLLPLAGIARAEYEQLAAEGMSHSQIAARLGVSRSTVAYHLRKDARADG